MAIQMRRGQYKDFDPDKLLPGEWAVSLDKKYVHMCFAAGVVMRMATYEAFEQDMQEIQDILASCQDARTAVDAMLKLAEQHKNDISEAAQVAAESEKNARESGRLAAEKAEAAAVSERNAGNSATRAENAAEAAKQSETASGISEIKSMEHETAAAESRDMAEHYKDMAEESASSAVESEAAATQKAEESKNYSDQSRSYAVGTGGETREGDDTDCAEYYYNQTKKISQGIGGIIPMGTISYEELDQPENQKPGYLFNISDSFVSDERFSDGGGVFYGAGSNVLYTADDMWDVLAASMVSGVKGASENEYRQGFISLSAENIGAAAKSDLDNINPLNAFYNNDSNKLDTFISDLDYIKQHPYLFGHSDALSNSLGYWVNVFSIKSGVFGQASQVAVGPNGMASRYHQHTTGTWSDWEISAAKSDLDTLKQSFQAGCSTIANAISSNGVTTADNASPGTMATNIGQIRSGGTADASAILEGITAYAKGNKITGTMKNWKRTPQHIDAVRLANNRFEVAVAAGYHGYSWTENSYEYLELSQVASTLGISAANIATGQTICGVTGTGTLYDKCFKYCYHNRSSVFYAKKEVLCIKTGETVTINWRDYLFNKEGAWYHTNGGAAQDWNGGVDPGVISYTYDNNTTSYTITGVKAGISVIRFRHAGGYSARIIVIVWDP